MSTNPTLEQFLEKSVTMYRSLESDLAVAQNDIAALRNMQGLAERPRGPVDFEAIGSFTKAAIAAKLGGPSAMQKVAAPWSIDVDARGGYVVPPQISAFIDTILRPEGSLLAACTQHTGEPGRDYRLPYYSTAPVAGWQPAENQDLSELDVAINAIDRPPIALGGYLDVSHQLLYGQSAFDVGKAVVGEIYNAARQAFELALVRGEGGVDAPYDGLIESAGSTQSALATVTPALVSKFIWESIEDAPSLAFGGKLVMSPAVFEALASSDGGSSYTSRLSITPTGGIRFGLHDIVRTPAAPDTAILLVEPRHVHLVNAGDTLIIDDRSQAKSLTVRLTAVRWAAYGITQADGVSVAEISALS
ncbi:MAG: phage major capsid protein [Candidatus Krumholzibacteria bacterium]|nr:phage major capsid protein [Candidatus Krumholzibacteria bacterium]